MSSAVMENVCRKWILSLVLGISPAASLTKTHPLHMSSARRDRLTSYAV